MIKNKLSSQIIIHQKVSLQRQLRLTKAIKRVKIAKTVLVSRMNLSSSLVSQLKKQLVSPFCLCQNGDQCLSGRKPDETGTALQ